MKWISFKDSQPNCKPDCHRKDKYFLVTDGKKIYVGWTDHNQWYARKENHEPSDWDTLDDTEENIYEFYKRMTHWLEFEDISLPG